MAARPFSEKTIRLYAEGNCHLLTFYLNKHLGESTVYILKNGDITDHSLIFYKGEGSSVGFFYDIYGRYPSKKSVIDTWAEVFEVSKEDLHLRKMKNISELELDRYSESEKNATITFISKNFGKIMNRDDITKEDIAYYHEIQGYADTGDAFKFLMANPMYRQVLMGIFPQFK